MGITDNQNREAETSEVDRTPSSFVYRLFDELRRSFFLSLTVVGGLLFISGLARGEGVVAGMLGIFGVTAILIGLGVYTTLWYLRDY